MPPEPPSIADFLPAGTEMPDSHADTLNGHFKLAEVSQILPRSPRDQMPDLDQVFADLTQLNLPISKEEIAAACAVYVSVRNTIYAEGYEPMPGAAPVRGVPGLVNFCLHAVVQGVLAVRDPQFREALRVHQAYYAGEDEEEYEVDGDESEIQTT